MNIKADISVRPIKKSEYGLLETFLYEAVHVPPGQAPYPKSIIDIPEIHLYIEDFGKANDVGLVAETDGKVVGFACARLLTGPGIKGFGNVDDVTPELLVSVLPEYRGQGIGTRLLIALHEALKIRGGKRISLSVQKTNPAAKLYHRLGYRTIYEQGEDDIMIKAL